MTPRIYELLLTRSQKWAIAVPIAMFAVMPIAFLVTLKASGLPAEMNANQPPFFPWLPFAPFLTFALVFGSSLALLPYRITVAPDGHLMFKALLKTRVVRYADVLSIEPSRLRFTQAGVTGYLLKYHGGQLRFPGQFTDQYLLLYELKKAKPSVELKGC